MPIVYRNLYGEQRLEVRGQRLGLRGWGGVAVEAAVQGGDDAIQQAANLVANRNGGAKGVVIEVAELLREQELSVDFRGRTAGDV